MVRLQTIRFNEKHHSMVRLYVTGDINWYTRSNFMRSNGFPLIFKAVKGECVRSLEHSWFNEAEVNEVYNTIKQLLPPNSTKNGLKSITQKDIGVVTPYRKQRHKISQKLRRFNLEDVTVGTAEIFQGKEKPIMIISTVRSNGALGFVAEERVCFRFYSLKYFRIKWKIVHLHVFFFCLFIISETKCGYYASKGTGCDHW